MAKGIPRKLWPNQLRPIFPLCSFCSYVERVVFQSTRPLREFAAKCVLYRARKQIRQSKRTSWRARRRLAEFDQNYGKQNKLLVSTLARVSLIKKYNLHDPIGNTVSISSTALCLQKVGKESQLP